jgi:hypothetical protein
LLNLTSNGTQSPLINLNNDNNDDGDLLSNMTDDNLMESAFSASLEDDSRQPPVTLDDSCKTWRHFSNVFESSQTLFWANFGLVDLENFDLTGIRQYTRFWALLMFGCYCFINVIVVLNLLIAMMNHSYEKISTRSDIEWKFARTRLWMSYFDTGSTVPAPFNIIPSIKSMCYFCRRTRKRLGRLYRWWTNSELCSSGMSQVQVNETDITNNNTKLQQQYACKLGQPSLVGGDRNGDKYRLDKLPGVARGHGEPTKIGQPPTGRKRAKLNYEMVIRTLVRRYLVDQQRKVEKGSALTEVKLRRWSKLNVFKRL